jgi:hypothetical protein
MLWRLGKECNIYETIHKRRRFKQPYRRTNSQIITRTYYEALEKELCDALFSAVKSIL